MARVDLHNLSKQFPGARGRPVPALDGVTLSVADGELLVVVGPSGAGKTTLLRLVAGLESPTAGTICIDGRDVGPLPPHRRDVALVFQNLALYPHLTVHENLAFGLRLRKLPAAEIEARVQEAAAWLGLRELLDRRPQALSGGERQRVALGRAMVRRPAVFLLDEPLSHLDAPLRTQMRGELRRLQRQLSTTTIYVTHDQAEAMSLGDRIAVLQAGAIQQVADPITLYRRPTSLFVAGFIGSPPMNFLRGALRRSEDAIWFHPAEPLAPDNPDLRLPEDQARALAGFPGQPVVLGLHAEHVALVPAGSTAGPQIMATVEMVEPLGAETRVHLRCGPCPLVARVAGARIPRPGERVGVRPDLAEAVFFDAASGLALASVSLTAPPPPACRR